jgi:anti-sigma regulatory factor (Ser/Thr protein kinase)
MIAFTSRAPYIPAERTIPATLGALAELGGHTRAFVVACGTGDREATAAALELAVHEVAVNIVRHAYAGRSGWISARYLLDGDDLVVTLTDAGRPWLRRSVPDPDPEEAQEGGYGLYLVRQLVDRVTYTRLQYRNHWELRVGRAGRGTAADRTTAAARTTAADRTTAAARRPRTAG